MGAEFLKNDDCGVVYAHAARDYGAMQRAIAALPGVAMIHSVKAPDLGPTDAPRVCQFRRVAKDLKDTWQDTMRLLDTANDESFLQRVGPGFFSDLDMRAYPRYFLRLVLRLIPPLLLPLPVSCY